METSRKKRERGRERGRERKRNRLICEVPLDHTDYSGHQRLPDGSTVDNTLFV